MNVITDEDVADYVNANIGVFHDKRLESLTRLQLANLLRRKNPYLFRSKGVATAEALVRALLDSHLASQEETLFGVFLEGLAVHVARIARGGRKSGAAGVDLEFEEGGRRYLVSIKSGPNWGNNAQVKRMRADFATAAKVIRQGSPNTHIVAVNGCCYGRDANADKGDYFKLCGQAFWRLISKEEDFYTRIVEPLGHDARRRNDDFAERYGAVVNQFAKQFLDEFCAPDGAIDWPNLVAFSSSGSTVEAVP